MSLARERVANMIVERFPHVEEVEDGVIRFERTLDNRAFAVCYVDMSENVPDSNESLNSYHERVVARRYFTGRKSLQWSNYVYFVVDEAPSRGSKLLVESDRRFARKFVVTEPELNIALSPPAFKVRDQANKVDVLGKWIEILSDAQLDKAVLNDESLPRRLELIESSYALRTPHQNVSRSARLPVIQPFLARIELRDFRPFPALREFDFGSVTLVCGANGTGKTSLMEAIELVYCGRTKRNPQTTDRYSIIARYSNGMQEDANPSRSNSTFRERNLAWYGQAEQKTQNLFRTFSRFNFLDADAAVGLADSTDDIEEELSKLLVGADAAKTWREIERTAAKLDEKVKELRLVRDQAESEEGSLERQLAAASGAHQESDSVLSKLDELLTSLLWMRPLGDSPGSVGLLVEFLSEFAVHVTAAVECDWVGSPVTLLSLRTFVADGEFRSSTASQMTLEHRAGTAHEFRMSENLVELERELEELRDLRNYVEAGLPRRLAEIEALGESIAAVERMHDAGPGEGDLLHLFGEESISVDAIVQATSRDSERAASELADARKRHAEFSVLRDQVAVIRQRLFHVASEVLAMSGEPDMCPLCQTKFPHGDLSQRIHSIPSDDKRFEETGAVLVAEMREIENRSDLANIRARAANWIWMMCGRIGESTGTSVAQVIRHIAEANADYARNVQERERLTGELTRLERSGLRADRYRQVSASVSSRRSLPTAEELGDECDSLLQRRKHMISALDEFRRKNQELIRRAAELLAAADATAADVNSAIARLEERLATTRSVLLSLEGFLEDYPFPLEVPLSELANTVRAIRLVAGDYQATLSRESTERAAVSEASARLHQVQTQIAGLNPRIERFVDARATLLRIQNEHSLSAAMEDALRLNRDAIEAIFERIHVPAEFVGLGEGVTTLVRREGGQATLSQISTGQRAAFALSLFLAQNAQLRGAPPLILMDDPIAHVDDLNCLSFLDYLREVVVAGGRQIVFATANDKLATLFQRKFDFLGEREFKRYDLSR